MEYGLQLLIIETSTKDLAAVMTGFDTSHIASFYCKEL